MSSAIYVWPEKPVTLKVWEGFCRKEGVVHSSRTVGGNYFYWDGYDGVEIEFGGWKDSNPSSTIPPSIAERISISTYFMGSSRSDVVKIAKKILRVFHGRYEVDEELKTLMAQKAD